MYVMGSPPVQLSLYANCVIQAHMLGVWMNRPLSGGGPQRACMYIAHGTACTMDPMML